MTTKAKILAGFSVMVLIMAVIAFFGYSGLQTATNSFMEYRRLARFNVLASDMVASMNRALGDVYLFTTTDDGENLKEARKELDTVAALVKEADPFISAPDRRKVLAQLVENEVKLKALVGSVEANLSAILKQYSDIVLPFGGTMSTQVMQMSETTMGVGNADGTKIVMRAMTQFGMVRAVTSHFSQSRDEGDGERALEALKVFGGILEELRAVLQTNQGRAQFQSLYKEYTQYTAAVTDMVAQCKLFQANMKELDKVGDATVKDIGVLSGQVNDDMLAQGQSTIDSNKDAQSFTMGLSIGGVIVAILLATFIIIGLVRVLRELGVFAGEIAAGHFGYAVKITEKGEVGEMVGAMQQIPEALNSILAEYQNLEKAVEFGNLGAEGQAEKFQGDFATLVKGTNGIMGRFRTVLENIPSPVVMLDGTLKASYINTVARKLAGDDYKGKTCYELFQREDFGSDTDALKVAVAQRAPAHAETVAHPPAGTMDISYTAIPMLNAGGEITSVMQLITDLTDIKQTQRTIMNVASQAAEISSRVAAASEELSAQVEQVSRGSEVQRARVESTASAMTQMNATVLEVARSAGQASEQSELTRNKADAGSELVNKVVESINTVNKVASTLQVNMQELGTQAESIGGVMNVISDIADQTNLLALNAAIEAARAGEAGRGFAVVADEVRKLAEKTMEATSEVGSNITAIQHSARVNIDAVGEAAKAVEEATELATSSGTALTEIVDLASSNSSVVASIATAAEEQSATSEEINHSINEINQIVGETTEGMVQASAAVQDLSHMAQELNRVMDQLK